jgi:SAM-dependent methyltransferase
VTGFDKKAPYEIGRAALLALPLLAADNSELLIDQVSALTSLEEPLSVGATERNLLLALDTLLVGLIDSPADVGGLATILAFRLRASRLTSLKATTEMLLSEYIGARAATAERIAQFYKEPRYAKILRDFDVRHDDPRPELIRELLLASGNSPERICDIGCGTADLGVATAEAIVKEAPHSVYVTRLDINKEIVYGADFEGKLSNDVHVTSYCADFFKPWPIPDSSQDLVVVAEVLEHAFDPEWLLREAKRVLRENGLVLITVPNAWHWRKVLRFLFRQRLERKFLSDHIQHFSKLTLKEIIYEEGFDILSVIPFSLHSESSVLFNWAPAKSIKRRLHHMYSRVPGCAWNYMALARLRRTRESEGSPTVQVSGIMTLGRELLCMSQEEAVRQVLSEGLWLLDRALQVQAAQGLRRTQAVVNALSRTWQHVLRASSHTGSATLETWLQSIDTSGWSKPIMSLLDANQGQPDGTATPEWEMVRREADSLWG